MLRLLYKMDILAKELVHENDKLKQENKKLKKQNEKLQIIIEKVEKISATILSSS